MQARPPSPLSSACASCILHISIACGQLPSVSGNVRLSLITRQTELKPGQSAISNEPSPMQHVACQTTGHAGSQHTWPLSHLYLMHQQVGNCPWEHCQRNTQPHCHAGWTLAFRHQHVATYGIYTRICYPPPYRCRYALVYWQLSCHPSLDALLPWLPLELFLRDVDTPAARESWDEQAASMMITLLTHSHAGISPSGHCQCHILHPYLLASWQLACRHPF